MLIIDRPSGIILTADRLAEVAALYGGPLPADYVAFMQVANGGYTELDSDKRAQVIPFRETERSPIGRELVARIYFIGEREADAVLGSVAASTMALRESGLARGVVAFGEFESTTYLCMKSAEAGAIYAYPQDDGFADGGILLASSFAAFCRLVYRHPYSDL